MDILEDFFTSEEAKIDAKKRLKKYHRARGLARMVRRVGEPFRWGIPPGETVQTVFSKLGFEVYDVQDEEIEQIFLTPEGASEPVVTAPPFVHYAILRVQKNRK